MRRFLLFAAAVIVTTVLLLLAGRSLFKPAPVREEGRVWPYGLGRLEDVPKRYPAREASTNATEVTRLAAPLGVDLEQEAGGRPRPPLHSRMRELRPFMLASLTKALALPGDEVPQTPPDVAAFLAKHGPALAAVRTQLVDNAPPRWTSDLQELTYPPAPNTAGHFELSLVLATDALDRHRRGDDAVAWQDLGAIWNLSRGLLAAPDGRSSSAGVFGARIVTGVAAKLAPPAPSWWSGLMTYDFDRAVVASMQYQAWRYVTFTDRYPVGEHDDDTPVQDVLRRSAEVVVGPFNLARARRAAAAMRLRAVQYSRSSACGPTQELESFWNAIRRFAAEREGVAKLLALREARAATGAWPENLPSIERSVCVEKSWSYARGPDGSMRLALTPAMPVPGGGRSSRFRLLVEFRYSR